jgi:hypothetical protein
LNRKDVGVWVVMVVRVLVNSCILYLMGVGSDVFLYLWPEPELNPCRTGFGCGFHFSSASAPETWKKPEKTQNPKETWKKLEKTWNPKETRKNLKETHLQNSTGTRNPTGSGSGVKFHPRVRMLNLTWLHFFTGQIFDQPDLNPTRCHP